MLYFFNINKLEMDLKFIRILLPQKRKKLLNYEKKGHYYSGTLTYVSSKEVIKPLMSNDIVKLTPTKYQYSINT